MAHGVSISFLAHAIAHTRAGVYTAGLDGCVLAVAPRAP